MEWDVRVGGAWQEVVNAHIRIGGTWTRIKEGWVRVGGAWQQFYGSVVTVSGEAITHSVSNGSTARAGVKVLNDGTIDKREGTGFTQIDTTTDWIRPNVAGVGDAWSVKCVTSGGDPLHGDTTDSWLALTSDREWYLEHGTTDTTENHVVTVQISDDGGTTVIDSGIYTLTATVGTPP